MKKSENRIKTVLLAALTAVLCLSIVAGATLALFTSESHVDITVSAGKVSISATVGEISTYSAQKDDEGNLIDENGKHYSYIEQEAGTFVNGGTAVVEGAKLTVTNITPGDKIVVPVTITNESTVAIVFGFNLKKTSSGSDEFGNALKCSLVDGVAWSNWAVPTTENEKIRNLIVEIYLPINANAQAEPDTPITFLLSAEAYQGNKYLDVGVGEATVKTDENKVVTETAAIEAGDVSVRIPVGTRVSRENIVVNAEKNDAEKVCSENSIETTLTDTALSYDVAVAGLAPDNTEPVAISFNIGSGKTIKAVYHKGTALTAATDGSNQTYDYNAETGIITIYSTTFSPFTVITESSGTVESPYLLRRAEDFLKIESGTADKIKHYKLISDAHFTGDMAKKGIGKNTWTLDYIPQTLSYVSIDGNGKSLSFEGTPVDGKYGAFIFNTLSNSELKNINIYGEHSALVVEAGNVDFDNIDIYGTMAVSGNYGVFLLYFRDGITFTDCNSYVEAKGTGLGTDYNAVFAGYGIVGSLTITFDNCNNYGNLTCGRASMFVGNGSQMTNATISINNCHNYGRIQATYMGEEYKPNPIISVAEKNVSALIIDGVTIEKTENYLNSHDFNGVYNDYTGSFYHGPQDNMEVTKNDDLTISFTASTLSNVDHYVVSVGLYCSWIDGSNRVFVTETIAATTDATSYKSTLKVLDFVDSAWVKTNGDTTTDTLCGFTTYTLGDTTYYLLLDEEKGNSLNGRVGKSTMVFVSSYDADGNLLSSVSL